LREATLVVPRPLVPRLPGRYDIVGRTRLIKIARWGLAATWLASVGLFAAGSDVPLSEWGFFVSNVGELAFWYVKDPTRFHRPVRLSRPFKLGGEPQ
jgi:hypothetical protein